MYSQFMMHGQKNIKLGKNWLRNWATISFSRRSMLLGTGRSVGQMRSLALILK